MKTNNEGGQRVCRILLFMQSWTPETRQASETHAYLMSNNKEGVRQFFIIFLFCENGFAFKPPRPQNSA